MLSSASSKTAFGLAHLLHTWRKPIRVIGLTSAANTDFVKSLGCYDEVVTYNDVTSLPADQPVAWSTWRATANCAQNCIGISATK